MVNAKSSKSKQIPAISIGRKELSEIRKLAETEVAVPVLDRTYLEVQQSLTIAALIKFLQTYGINVPFELSKEE